MTKHIVVIENNFHNFQYVSTCNTIKYYIEKGVVWRLSEFFLCCVLPG